MKSANEQANNAQLAELKLQLEKANEKSATLLQELQTIAPVAKQVDPLKEELKEVLEAKSSEESRSASLALSVQTNQDLLMSLELEKRTLQESLQELQATSSASEAQLEKMKVANEHANNAQLAELKLQLEKANEKSATLLQELQTIAPVAKQVEPLKNELKEALDAKSLEESRSASLALSLQTNQDLLASKQATQEQLNAELVDLKSLLEKSKEEVKRVRKSAESAEEQHAISVQVLEDKQSQAVGNLRAEITRLEAIIAEKEAEFRRELSSKLSQELDVGTLKSEVTALNARLQDADERAKEAFEKYERSEKDVEECLEEMEHMRKFHEKDALELDAVRKAKEEVEARLHKLATDYANESQQSHRLKKEVKSLEQQVAKLSDQLDQMVSTSASKTSRIKGMSQESDNLKSKIDQLNNDKKSLGHQIETLKQEIAEKEVDKDREELLAALKKSREQTTQTAIENSSLRANQVRAKEQFNNHVKRLETDVNYEREQVKKLKDENRRLMHATSENTGARGGGNQPGLDASYVGPQHHSHKRPPLQSVNQQQHPPVPNTPCQTPQPSETSAAKATPASTADMTPRSRLDENSAAFKEKLAKFEKGHWRDGGSGWMKEDALDLAKGRVYKLDLQLKEEMKKSLKESQAKDFYRARGGQWKSSFMELSDRVGRKACKDCHPRVSKLVEQVKAHHATATTGGSSTAASATPSSGGGASGGGHLNPTPQSTPASASAPSTSHQRS